MAMRFFGSFIAFVAINGLFIWLVAWILVKNNRLTEALRASWYQALLWIPAALLLLVLVMPVAADVDLPEERADLLEYWGPLLMAAFVSGMLGVKWSYELGVKAAVFLYGLALGAQVFAYRIVGNAAPELWDHVPTLGDVRAILPW